MSSTRDKPGLYSFSAFGVLLGALVLAFALLGSLNMLPGSDSGSDAPAEKWQLHLTPVDLKRGDPVAVHETIYLPVYAHIYYADRTKLLNLAETVSIRNTDMDSAIILTSVRHYRTDGSLVKDYVTKPLSIGPLATADYVVPEHDTTGGTGANFIIEWVSRQKVSEPITESVMVYTGSSHSVSFLSRGVVLKREEGITFGTGTSGPADVTNQESASRADEK